MNAPAALQLVVRRIIPASRERLFEAWTTPEQLLVWWGPRGVRCTGAEVDPREGGRYRLHHELPDGRSLVISGQFLRIEPPAQLVYTWRLDPGTANVQDELVTVQFVARGSATEVVITHERIADERQRDGHEVGWEGCLDGLVAMVS